MIEYEYYIANTIHRFELTANSATAAHEKAFSLYGILLFPALLGSGLMYNVFHLEGMYFIMAFMVMMGILVNVYFFYQRTIAKNQTLKLIIQEGYIQLIDHQQIHVQEEIKHITIQLIRCGKHLQPALRLSGEYFQGIIIGLKNIEIENAIETHNKLCQPDYWLSDKQQAEQLMALVEMNFELEKSTKL